MSAKLPVAFPPTFVLPVAEMVMIPNHVNPIAMDSADRKYKTNSWPIESTTSYT